MKTREFMAEMKVLCKVHHTNLIELIGYAASTDDLFLVYEYAQKGSLRNHLHDPQSKGMLTSILFIDIYFWLRCAYVYILIVLHLCGNVSSLPGQVIHPCLGSSGFK